MTVAHGAVGAQRGVAIHRLRVQEARAQRVELVRVALVERIAVRGALGRP